MKIIKIDFLTIYLLIVLFITGYIHVGIVIFLIVIIHELGHVTMAILLKYKVSKIVIYPFGGITTIDKDLNTSINHELLIAIGGILFQLILLVISYFLPIRVYIKDILFKYNISIMLFNLLPIIPLDGSKISYSILNNFFSFKKSYLINIYISIIGIILYIVFNYWFSINNYLIISLFIYKIYEYIVNYKYIHNRFLLERFLNKYNYKKISTKEGNLDILMIDTYQYFKEGKNIVKEEEKLRKLFDNKPYFW